MLEAARPRTPAPAGRLAHLAGGGRVAPLRRGAHSGVPARAAAGARLGLAAVRGREREGRYAGGAQGHPVAARRDPASIRCSRAFCRNTRSRSACATPTSCGCTSSAWPTITPTWRWSTFRAGICAAACAAGISPSEALGFASQIARALSALHARGHPASRPQARQRDAAGRRPDRADRLRPGQARGARTTTSPTPA